MTEEWISPEHEELVAQYRAAQDVAEDRGEDPRLRWFLQPAE